MTAARGPAFSIGVMRLRAIVRKQEHREHSDTEVFGSVGNAADAAFMVAIPKFINNPTRAFRISGSSLF
jgi:hypothetical protein